MIAGRLRWERRGAKPPGKNRAGGLRLSRRHLAAHRGQPEKTRRAVCRRGTAALEAHDPAASKCSTPASPSSGAALQRENHTLKRALTDPHLFSGIGNAYSDEILHAARLSPVQLTSKLVDAEVMRLYRATQATLRRGRTSLRVEFGDRFPGPGEITAFREASPCTAVRQALPGLHWPRSTHPLRRQRDQLLSHLPIRRSPARRPLAVAAAQIRLAEDARKKWNSATKRGGCEHPSSPSLCPD
jgi:ribosomal protein S13